MTSLPGDCMPWCMQLHLKKITIVIFVMALPIAANKMDTDLNQDGCGELEPMGRVYHGKPIGKENMPWMMHTQRTYFDGMLEKVKNALRQKENRKSVNPSTGKEMKHQRSCTMVQVFAFYDLSSDVAKACGGSIITRNLILTASHCLFERGAYALKVMVLYNSKLNSNGKAYQAEKMMVHPKYVSKAQMVHDIALLKLAVDLEFNRVTKPVCLPTKKMDIAGKTLVVAGWGGTESANDSKVLQYADVVALTDEECKELLRTFANPITLQHVRPGPAVCAYDENKGACQGDSGGPLTLANDDGRTLQVGVVSFGMSCPSTTPTVYTSVYSHMKWIRRALNRPRKWKKLEHTRRKYKMGQTK